MHGLIHDLQLEIVDETGTRCEGVLRRLQNQTLVIEDQKGVSILIEVVLAQEDESWLSNRSIEGKSR
jgi:hypothetical protein